MRTRIASVVVLALAPVAAGQVKISQVHAQSSVYNRDYVELFNTSSTPVDVSGWWLHSYWSWPGETDTTLMLSGVIPPHAYFLVSVTSTGSGAAALPASPDLTGSLSMHALHERLLLNRPDFPYAVEVDAASWYTAGQPDYALPMNGANALVRAGGGCIDGDVDQWSFDLASPSPRNSAVTHVCAFVGPDCNRNAIDDRDEIIDDPTLDCDGNNRLDSCEGVTGPFPDCNQNGVPDCTEIRNGAPDANANRRPDTCEGAAVIAAPASVTVLASGVSSDSSAWRVAGSQSGNGPAYAVVRWDNAAIRQQLSNSQYGYRFPYLDLREIGTSDAAGALEVFYTHNDAVALTPGAPFPTYADLDTIFADRERLNTLDFRPHVSGSEHSLFLSESLGCPGPAGSPTDHLMNDIRYDAVTTLVIVASSPGAAAAFAGAGNAGWPGPRLVFFPIIGLSCGNADYNGDGDSGTDADIYDFFACLAGDCCLRCGCMDYNGDGDWGTDADIEAFFRVLAGSC
jgi:hypothetical protein